MRVPSAPTASNDQVSRDAPPVSLVTASIVTGPRRACSAAAQLASVHQLSLTPFGARWRMKPNM